MIGVLAGCGSSDVEGLKRLAIQECVKKSLEVQDYDFASGDEAPLKGDRLFEYAIYAGPPDTAPFKLDMDPEFFTIDYGDVKMPWPKKAYSLKCSGTFPTRRITTVAVNGQIFRPANGESWEFADPGRAGGVPE